MLQWGGREWVIPGENMIAKNEVASTRAPAPSRTYGQRSDKLLVSFMGRMPEIGS
jgi:hypothetical protein